MLLVQTWALQHVSTPGIAILHAATAVTYASQSSLVPDQAPRLEQGSCVCVGLLGDDWDHHHPRRGGPVWVLLLHDCRLLLGLDKHLPALHSVNLGPGNQKN